MASLPYITPTKIIKGTEYKFYLDYPTRQTAENAAKVLQGYGAKAKIVDVRARKSSGEYNYAVYTTKW